ncbi:MAG: response regulator transcription factor, partial [Streptosporangiaceae bacterium]
MRLPSPPRKHDQLPTAYGAESGRCSDVAACYQCTHGRQTAPRTANEAGNRRHETGGPGAFFARDLVRVFCDEHQADRARPARGRRAPGRHRGKLRSDSCHPGQGSGGPRRSSRAVSRLASAGERAVLTLMAEGRSNAGIAGRLYLSPKSVERHVAAVFDTLGLP